MQRTYSIQDLSITKLKYNKGNGHLYKPLHRLVWRSRPLYRAAKGSGLLRRQYLCGWNAISFPTSSKMLVITRTSLMRQHVEPTCVYRGFLLIIQWFSSR